jgi:hypothetical protein
LRSPFRICKEVVSIPPNGQPHPADPRGEPAIINTLRPTIIRSLSAKIRHSASCARPQVVAVQLSGHGAGWGPPAPFPVEGDPWGKSDFGWRKRTRASRSLAHGVVPAGLDKLYSARFASGLSRRFRLSRRLEKEGLMMKINAFALFGAFLGAQAAAAQTMTLTSADIAPGEASPTSRSSRALAAAAATSRRLCPGPERRRTRRASRSRFTIPTADRQRLLALGRLLQYPG